ncbi:MAG TPA: TonB-dependent receptor [Rhizomicrobium sp.]|nr:TonB-dependent receptor [Rhizomicrobium sp.]
MIKKSIFFWAYLCAAPAWADAEQGISVYPASFFADARPATAYDMVSRLPGFLFDNGLSARGFAGTAGNVLVNGARPTAKTDDLQTILTRIPAENVQRIDVIHGGAPGIDMQGQTVVADVITRADASDQTILSASLTYTGAGQWSPSAGVEYHGQAGALRYEAALSRLSQIWDDSPGGGYRVITTPGQAPVYDRAVRTGMLRLGYSAHGGLIAPLWGGEWNNNFTLQTTDYPSGVRYDGNGGSRFDSNARVKSAEFGSHWQGLLGRVNLETLVLQRLGHEDDSNTSAAVGSSAIFLSGNDTGESIARVTARYSFSPELSLEAGGEGAYNFLDAHSSFVSNGSPVTVPNANLLVDETRAEAFASATWKVTPVLTLEGGARFEFSTISAVGDSRLNRSFFYPKPRLLISWSPDDKSQFRLRVEKKLGQLNFTDFAASSNLAGFGISAGTLNLRPEQRWQFEGAIERHFWERGGLVLSVLHEDVTDLQDYVPVGGGLDAAGNVPHATQEKLSLSGTVPLDFLGLKNGLFKPNVYWATGSLIDPVTGQQRRISKLRNISSYYEITQDLDSLKSTWSLSWGTGFSQTSWRISQITRTAIHNNPYLNFYWAYKPTPDWMIKLGADNFASYRFEQEQFNYAGPRNLAPLSSIQDVFDHTQPRFYIQLRKTF